MVVLEGAASASRSSREPVQSVKARSPTAASRSAESRAFRAWASWASRSPGAGRAVDRPAEFLGPGGGLGRVEVGDPRGDRGGGEAGDLRFGRGDPGLQPARLQDQGLDPLAERGRDPEGFEVVERGAGADVGEPGPGLGFEPGPPGDRAGAVLDRLPVEAEAVADLADGLGLAEDRVPLAEPPEFGVDLLEVLRRVEAGPGRRPEVGEGLEPAGGEAFGEDRHVGPVGQFRGRLGLAAEDRQGGPDPFQPPLLLLDPADLGDDRGVAGLPGRDLAVEVDPRLGRQHRPLGGDRGGRQVVERRVDRRLRALPEVEGVHLGFERLADVLDPGQARAGGEEHLAEPPLALDDQGAPADELGVVDREQVNEPRFVYVAQEREQRVAGKLGGVVERPERLEVALPAGEGQLGAGLVADHGGQAEGVVVAAVGVAGGFGEAEEEGADGPEGGALAGLVRSPGSGGAPGRRRRGGSAGRPGTGRRSGGRA